MINPYSQWQANCCATEQHQNAVLLLLLLLLLHVSQYISYLVALTNFSRNLLKITDWTYNRLVQRQTSPWLMKLDLYVNHTTP